MAITFFSIGSLRSPENRGLPYNQLNNCAKFDLNLKKIFFELSRTQENYSGGGSVTTLNPVYPRDLREAEKILRVTITYYNLKHRLYTTSKDL